MRLSSSKSTACYFGEVFQFNLLTLSRVSTILYGSHSSDHTGRAASAKLSVTQSGNNICEPACVFSCSCYPVWAKTASVLLGVHNETLAYDSDSGVELLSSTTYVDLLVIRIPNWRGPGPLPWGTWCTEQQVNQGISKLFLMIQSVQLQKLSIICFLSKKS